MNDNKNYDRIIWIMYECKYNVYNNNNSLIK